MKRFCVSKDCNACGECILQTELLTEDSTGHAVPEADKYIKNCDLESAEKLVAACPTHALSIEETADVVLNAAELSDSLEKKLKSIQIPRITNHDIKFNESDYTIDYGYISGEDSYSYSSKSKAREAGQSRFRATFWNHRKDFALSYLARYKSKVLRKFYDFTDPSKTYYSHFDDQFEKILKEAKAKLSAASGTDFSLPDDFAEFRPELSPDFQSNSSMDWLRDIDSTVYVNEFFEGFEKNRSQCLSYYEGCIYSHDDVQVIGTDWLGNNKIKTTYCFRNANNTGKELVRDVGFSLRCASSCGMRCVDEIAAERLKSILDDYRNFVKEEIQAKVSIYKSVVEKICELQEDTTMATEEVKKNETPVESPELPKSPLTPVSSAITDSAYWLLGKSAIDRSNFAETNDYLVSLHGSLVDDAEEAEDDEEEDFDAEDSDVASKDNPSSSCEIWGIHKETGATTQIDLTSVLGSQWNILFDCTNYCTQENTIYIPVLYNSPAGLKSKLESMFSTFQHTTKPQKSTPLYKILCVNFDTQEVSLLKPVLNKNGLSCIHLTISENLLIAFMYDTYREEDEEDANYKAFLVDLVKEERTFPLMPKINVADMFAYAGQILVLGCDGLLYTYDLPTRKCKTYVDLKSSRGICGDGETFPIMYRMFQINGVYLFVTQEQSDERFGVYRLTKKFEGLADYAKVCISNGRLLCIEDGRYFYMEQYDLNTAKKIKEPELEDFPEDTEDARDFCLLGDYLYQDVGNDTAYKLNLKEDFVWEYI